MLRKKYPSPWTYSDKRKRHNNPLIRQEAEKSSSTLPLARAGGAIGASLAHQWKVSETYNCSTRDYATSGFPRQAQAKAIFWQRDQQPPSHSVTTHHKSSHYWPMFFSKNKNTEYLCFFGHFFVSKSLFWNCYI